jgi:hypothetical protein
LVDSEKYSNLKLYSYKSQVTSWISVLLEKPVVAYLDATNSMFFYKTQRFMNVSEEVMYKVSVTLFINGDVLSLTVNKELAQ